MVIVSAWMKHEAARTSPTRSRTERKEEGIKPPGRMSSSEQAVDMSCVRRFPRSAYRFQGVVENGFRQTADYTRNAKTLDSLEGFGYVFVGVAQGDGTTVGAGCGVLRLTECIEEP